MANGQKLAAMHATIADAMEELARGFVPGVRLTFVARLPGDEECELVVTNDLIPGAVATLLRRHAEENPVPS